MDPALVSTSKFLSLVLRHQPEAIGLALDEAGWASIAELLELTRASGRALDHDLLLRVVRENDKQRFTISGDGLRIRASQGHSIDVDLGLVPIAPPAVLYHGTVANFLESIRAQGLLPGSRQYVHLSADERTAEIVGTRRGKPVILKIDAARMAAEGLEFFQSANGVWLTAHVPAGYIAFP
jgi:putative RNA 2'-phosphotransferase